MLILTLERLTARATLFKASSCPFTLLFSSSFKAFNFSKSLSLILEAGIPVQSSITKAKSSSVTTLFEATLDSVEIFSLFIANSERTRASSS